MLRALRGTRSWALRVTWTRQRCQDDAEELLADRRHEARVVVADDEADARARPRSTSAPDDRAARRCPRRCRRTARARAPGAPRVSAAPPATRAAIDSTWPSLRTLRYVGVEPEVRVRRCRRAAGCRTPRPRRRAPRRSGSTSLLLMPSIPSARTRSSTAPRADAPTRLCVLPDAIWSTVKRRRARSAGARGPYAPPEPVEISLAALAGGLHVVFGPGRDAGERRENAPQPHGGRLRAQRRRAAGFAGPRACRRRPGPSGGCRRPDRIPVC